MGSTCAHNRSPAPPARPSDDRLLSEDAALRPVGYTLASTCRAPVREERTLLSQTTLS